MKYAAVTGWQALQCLVILKYTSNKEWRIR